MKKVVLLLFLTFLIGNQIIAQNGEKISLPDTLEFDEEMNKLFISRYKYTFKDKLRRFLKELLRYKINK